MVFSFSQIVLMAICLALPQGQTGPSFTTKAYTATVGINTTVGTTLATLLYTFTDPNEVVTFSMDTSSNGYSYFGFSGDNVILAAGLDVEYGGTSWVVNIIATDNGTVPETDTATLMLTTYVTQTTTPTTTPAPPGYSWFDNQDNLILFGSFFGFMAFMTGICILMCFRFHRIGTCLPRSCPEYKQCRASFRRQADCCALPCVFSDHKPLEHVDSFFDDRETTVTSSLSKRAEPSDATTTFVEAKSKKSSKPKSKLPPPIRSVTPVSIVPPPIRSVTPVSIGNVDLREAGFDGMRSPGFNAPMFTSYGGSSGITGMKKKKKF